MAEVPHAVNCGGDGLHVLVVVFVGGDGSGSSDEGGFCWIDDGSKGGVVGCSGEGDFVDTGSGISGFCAPNIRFGDFFGRGCGGGEIGWSGVGECL